jgi:hypothetical protein
VTSFWPTSPIVVTFRGSVALEAALLGIRPVVLGEAVCHQDCVLRMKNRDMYRSALVDSGRDAYLLGDGEVETARAWKAQINDALVQ